MQFVGFGEKPEVCRSPGREPDNRGLIVEGPRRPIDLTVREWLAALRRTAAHFRANNLTDTAAALTYYGILSIFPALIVLVSIVGLAGDSATQSLLDNLTALGPGAGQDIVRGAIEQIAASRGTAGVAFVLGLAVALWSASGYVGAFSRAANLVYEVEETRPFWKLRPLQLAITLGLLFCVALIPIAVVLTGPLAEQVGTLAGLGNTAVTLWGIAKWPAIAAILIGMLALLYYVAPNVRHRGFRWITPGGVLATLLWIAASAGFAAYVANFGSYNKTYGSLAGVIVFLVWIWISNAAILLGVGLNAELERGSEVEKHLPEDQTIAVEPRARPGRA
jgi:membrane protein